MIHRLQWYFDRLGVLWVIHPVGWCIRVYRLQTSSWSSGSDGRLLYTVLGEAGLLFTSWCAAFRSFYFKHPHSAAALSSYTFPFVWTVFEISVDDGDSFPSFVRWSSSRATHPLTTTSSASTHAQLHNWQMIFNRVQTIVSINITMNI